MIVPFPSSPPAVIDYPDDDGKPMSDNTLQFQWINTLQGGLDDLFRDNPDVFVAGNLLWYPVEGKNKIRQAPDAMVAFGRPKGYRGSYKQWVENGVPPQVVFEVLSPGKANEERDRETKLTLYSRRGVRECWIINRFTRTVAIYRRTAAAELVLTTTLTDRDTLTSPLLPDFALAIEDIFLLP